MSADVLLGWGGRRAEPRPSAAAGGDGLAAHGPFRSSTCAGTSVARGRQRRRLCRACAFPNGPQSTELRGARCSVTLTAFQRGRWFLKTNVRCPHGSRLLRDPPCPGAGGAGVRPQGAPPSPCAAGLGRGSTSVSTSQSEFLIGYVTFF